MPILGFYPIDSEDDSDADKSVNEAAESSLDQVEEVCSAYKNGKSAGDISRSENPTDVSPTASTSVQKIEKEEVAMDMKECHSKCRTEIRRWRQVKTIFNPRYWQAHHSPPQTMGLILLLVYNRFT